MECCVKGCTNREFESSGYYLHSNDRQIRAQFICTPCFLALTEGDFKSPSDAYWSELAPKEKTDEEAVLIVSSFGVQLERRSGAVQKEEQVLSDSHDGHVLQSYHESEV